MSNDSRLQQLLDETLDWDRTPEEVCVDCPELLPEVRRRWQQTPRSVKAEFNALVPTPAPTQEGDTPVPWNLANELPRIPGYAIESVLGRGGMGIVFRARHLRLNRLVALKMLLSGAYAGPKDLARFQREAEAVAGLRHPHIVQVHDVGEHDGQPYFTMELVEGGSLAEKLQGTPQPARQAAALLAMLAATMHVAHRGGIVHRDLKPANILLTPDGAPKISDFGLARRLHEGTTLTQSGIPVGTPSYMAPEQAQGQAHAIGPAVDVYALGAILYELLTGRPPFQGETAASTIHQVITQDPVPPSRLNFQVPGDLETICLKCLQKPPQQRYEDAQALADDLWRFGEGRPIQARPLGAGARLWRWCRRNPAAAALVAVALLLVGLASGGGVWLVQQRAERQAETARHDAELRNEVHTAVAQAVSLRKGFHFHEARELLEQARHRLEPAGPDNLRRQVDQGRADLDLAERLDAARLRAGVLFEEDLDHAEAEEPYVAAFAEAGLGPEGDDVEAATARVRDSAVCPEVVAALDDWASITPDPARRAWLLAVARKADPDPARDRLRQPELWQDSGGLAPLARELSVAELSPQLATALGRVARLSGEEVVALLTAAHARFPQDFWINLQLGVALFAAERRDEALGYFRAALALRPETSAAHDDLGVALLTLGRTDEAVGHFQQARRLDPKDASACRNLGTALRARGQLAEAVDCFRQALRLNPRYARAHYSLGLTLRDKGRLEEAIDHLQQAVRLDPRNVWAQNNLSMCWYAAACAGAQAAAGPGPGDARPCEPARTALRRQALNWLRADLALRPRLLQAGKVVGRPLSSWQTDPALASVRDRTALAKMPDDEGEQWQRLWADVAALSAADPLEQGQALAARREWARASDCYARALKRGPTSDGHFCFEYAALRLLSGDRQGYAATCARMVERNGKATDLRAYHVARACTLAEGAVADAELPSLLAERELKAHAEEFWSLTEQGALAYRAGRLRQAVPLFEQSLEADSRPGRAAVNWLWLALANQRLGRAEESLRWLGKAQSLLDQYGDEMPERADETLGLDMHNWLEAHVLRREAEALLSPPQTVDPVVASSSPRLR
jgi:serine/threonine-protein kinase